jgi:hypothetical protein
MIRTEKISDGTFMATNGREQTFAGTRATAKRRLLADLRSKREDAEVYAREQRCASDCDCPSGWHRTYRACR